jgi:hypothetical protein
MVMTPLFFLRSECGYVLAHSIMRSPNSSRLVPAASHSVQVATGPGDDLPSSWKTHTAKNERTEAARPAAYAEYCRGMVAFGFRKRACPIYLCMSGGIAAFSHRRVHLFVRADILGRFIVVGSSKHCQTRPSIPK